ncbi:HD domain-containing phosphohydrolase [Thermosipho atlanticus]|uniref:HDIG domain-containing protein n=1 Tax=Thermosipho atlanticus DSM 15807 TaxID=1123380 RepID=A0A1M5RZ20_9BACT|nr:HD domain-containing phosphohydrolase [Thermosipho atlanticus]SHH31053.1 HDIG domain-containing protein [Thermosipho atlanticus DSM 15807]
MENMETCFKSIPEWYLYDMFFQLCKEVFPDLAIHSLDVAKISALIMKRINNNTEDIQQTFIAGFFHDLGFAFMRETIPMDRITVTFDPEGYYVFNTLPNFDNMADKVHYALISFKALNYTKVPRLSEEYLLAILHHHNPIKDNSKPKVSLISNILFIADKISLAIRAGQFSNINENVCYLKKLINKFNLKQIVLDAVNDLLSNLEDMAHIFSNQHPEKFFKLFALEQRRISLDIATNFFEIIAALIDFRSLFTYRHSSSIAALARDLTFRITESKYDALLMYTAGLLHDLGKIKTPLKILHHPGKLPTCEMFIMKQHIVFTRLLLEKYSELNEIVSISAAHHERLDGSGYPYGFTESQLPILAQLLQVVDIFVALTEERPYRNKIPTTKAFEILDKMVENRKINKMIVNILKEMINEGYSFENVTFLSKILTKDELNSLLSNKIK